MNYLLDLERSITSGIMTYWKPNRHGYTTSFTFAGKYTDTEATKTMTEDFDKRTIAIPVAVVEGLKK